MPSKIHTEPSTLKDPKSTDRTGTGYSAKTILFNDNSHTFDAVARQLMKAIGCSYSRGLALANVVHLTGSAVVYSGPLERCEAVAMTLEAIGLNVNVET